MTSMMKVGILSLNDGGTETLVSDELTIDDNGFFVVAAESSTTDDLSTITYSVSGVTSGFVVLRADTGDTITIKHGVDNISLNDASDFALSGDKTVMLFWDGTVWVDVGAGAAGAADWANPGTIGSSTPNTGVFTTLQVNSWAAFSGWLTINASAFIYVSDASGTFVKDSNANEMLVYTRTASAVNHLQFSNAATGNPPTLESAGDDTNVGLRLIGKGTGFVEADGLQLYTTSELTISSGAITITNAGRYTVDTESDASSDNLDTISGGADGKLLIISPEHTDRTVVVRHGVGNIYTLSESDLTLDSTEKSLLLICDGANWHVIGDGAAGGGGASGAVDVEGTAGENLSVRDAVYLNPSDSEWYQIDADADPPEMSAQRGMVEESGGIASSSTGTIREFGVLGGFTGLTPFAPVYASTTAGGYTQTKPTVTDGGGQVALCVLGYAISATEIFITSNDLVRFLERESLAQDGTLTIKHYSDAAEQTRKTFGYLSSSAEESLTSYSDTNQDADVELQGRNGAGSTTDVNATGDFVAIGNPAGTSTWQAQSFQITAGIFSQFKITHSSNGGTPSGTMTWQLCADSAGDPGSVLDTGTYTPVASTENTINVSDGPFLSSSTTYWMLLKPTTPQSSGNAWRWVMSSTGSVYANGTLKSSTNGGSSWTDQSTDAACEFTTSAITAKSKLAQSFQIATGTTITEVRLYLKKVGSPTGNLTVKIETDSAGDPSGTPVTNGTSDTVAASTLSTSYGYISFTFATDPSLSATTTYWLVLETADSQSNTDYVIWGADESSPSYADGEMKSYTGSWAAESKDAIFNVLGMGTTYDEPIGIHSWTLVTDSEASARFDDGSGTNADTQTTFRNNETSTLDLTFEVVLP